MTEARPENPTSEFSKAQGESRSDLPRPKWQWPKAPSAGTGELLTLTEIEAQFGLSEYRIYQWVDEGRLHAVQIGKRFKYPDWEVRELLRFLFGALGAAA